MQMAAAIDHDEIQDLRSRIETAETKLRRIKFVLIAAAALVVCLLIPPLRAVVGFGVIVAVILVSLFVYMYAVIWACERVFGNTAQRRETRADEAR